MKHNALLKTVAVLLAVVSVVGLILSGITVFCNLNYGLYTSSPQEQAEDQLANHSYCYAREVAEEYAFSQAAMPREIWYESFSIGYLTGNSWPAVDYRICDASGKVLSSDEINLNGDYYYTSQETVSILSGVALKVGEDYELYPEYREDPADEVGVTAPTQVPAAETFPAQTLPQEEAWYELVTTDDGDVYRIYQNDTVSEYTVELFYTEAQYNAVLSMRYSTSVLMGLMYQERYDAIVLLGVSAVVLILMMTYLACAAGRRADSDEIRPGGLNRMPLDLYAALDCFVGFWLMWILFDPVMNALFGLDRLWNEPFWVLMLAAVGLSAGIGLICILFWTALCAQVKAGSGFWLRNTLVGRFGSTIWSWICKAFGFVGGVATRAVSKVGDRVGGNMPRFSDVLREMNSKLPLMWQWLGISLLMFAVLALVGSFTHNGFGMFFYLIIVAMCVLAIIYGANAFGTIRTAARKMAQGDLDAKIQTDGLEACFKELADDLNVLGDVCVEAARKQMKSERMRTELITNVSHDIKTPLTSIINYVDLLQKAETQEQRAEYLEVLDRQSQRLKKLIEDLIEMSKASSGNVAVEITPTDVMEAVNQALGEFADRLEKKGLQIILKAPAEPLVAQCDGKLLWRVMSNVLGNVVKYAMPGTRVYVELNRTEYRIELSVKNISADELNVTADELLERFVRGDESRNTDGNGLGLNIAKSLMEVQGGTLDLVVDGDLFKVVLTLKAAENPNS